MFNRAFSGKKVLVTGHTGFKGSWLCLWLHSLGAEVYGISKSIVSEPNHFEAAGLNGIVDSALGDISDPDVFSQRLAATSPDFVFHMAAQPLVPLSYQEPYETMKSNIMGTTLVLDALREYEQTCVAVIITSDKCYENIETYYGYREDDKLGGADPYSASKAAAEVVTSAYFRSFLEAKENLRVGVTRAGNVIGGGDWAEARLIPDIVRAWQASEQLEIRSPLATRPWQHVLEPLSGYLQLAQALSETADKDEWLNGQAFNFGPAAEAVHPVTDLVAVANTKFDGLDVHELEQVEFHEAGLLKLCCDKAYSGLDWSATLDFDETIDMTFEWYTQFYSDSGSSAESVLAFSKSQLDEYISKAKERSQSWTA